MAFLSTSKKVSAYSPNIRYLVSKLRLLSAQTGTSPLISPSALGQILNESSQQQTPPNLEKLFASSTDCHGQQGMQEIVKAHSEELLETAPSSDLLSSPTHTPKATSSFTEPKAVELKIVECPESMKQKVRDLFPGEALTNVSVLNLTQVTQNDMSAWSADMEIEWMVASSGFVETAVEVCKILKSFGYWADFINPSSGKPHLSKYHTDATLHVTDDEYRSLGFDVSDLGCVRILAHKLWGTRVFIGTIFTDAPINSLAVNEIISKSNIV